MVDCTISTVVVESTVFLHTPMCRSVNDLTETVNECTHVVVISNVDPEAVVVETSVSVCVMTLMLIDSVVAVAVAVRVTVMKLEGLPLKIEGGPDGPMTMVTGRPDHFR